MGIFSQIFSAKKVDLAKQESTSTPVATPPPPPPKPEWTPEDEAKLEQLEKDRVQKTYEGKLEIFSKLPVEVREEVLRELRVALVRKAISDISGHEAWISGLWDLERKKSEATGLGRLGSHMFRSTKDEFVDKMPAYDDLLKVHADHAAGEILLGDKRK